MRKNIILRTFLAVALVLVVSFVSFILTSDFNDFISGRSVAQVRIDQANATNCSVQLKQGVNMVSFYCEPGFILLNKSMVDASNASLDYYAVFLFNPNNLNDSWSSYNPSLPAWATQSLSTLNRRSGYAVVMNTQGEYFHDGYRFANTRIPLQTGWNFIGYPSDVEKNISEALYQLDGNYTLVEAFQVLNGSNAWRSYVPGTGGTLEWMEPMVGYWIFMNTSQNLVIDW